MEVNWVIIGIVALVVLVIVILTIRKNQREKKKLTDLLNNDFTKQDEEEPDSDNDVNER
ncbi:hypothetical protein [Flavobacterium olei]|uniref:hypothetical protein n=1 Tax=Flavobacterium olei TaxID=1886782 RepID=UPI00321BB58B